MTVEILVVHVKRSAGRTLLRSTETRTLISLKRVTSASYNAFYRQSVWKLIASSLHAITELTVHTDPTTR
jgi:hypothetical protein